MITEKQSTIAMVCITVIYITYVILSNKRSEELQRTMLIVDSLRNEIILKDKFIDDSYHVEIDLNNKINWLYDKYPAIHKEMFEDASN